MWAPKIADRCAYTRAGPLSSRTVPIAAALRETRDESQMDRRGCSLGVPAMGLPVRVALPAW